MRFGIPLKTTATAAWMLFYGCVQAASLQTGGEPVCSAKLVAVVWDESQLPIPGATVEIKLADQRLAATTTTENGRAEFVWCKPGRFAITASSEGFETSAQGFEWKAGFAESLQLTLKPAASKQSIDVQDTASPIDVVSKASVAVGGEIARELPSRPATVADALPMIPGIARQPSGQLQLSGSGEHRSTMMVNSADVTDPATGGFGLTVPIDSVESINFYQASFLAEYGRYSAGLVSVETRRGGEEWKWELNDPFPEFYIRSWHLRGLRTATPRVNFEGPIIPGKLYLLGRIRI